MTTGDAPNDPVYAARVGRKLRSLLNDLKRNEDEAAKELGLPLDTLRRILAGKAELPLNVAARAAELWPVSASDFYPVRDDTPDGVRVMRNAESATTSRTLIRGGTPYYEYRDTAMTRLASFRPEWIRPLQTVEAPDPSDARVQWNDGHFLFQLTYFAGDINFYSGSSDTRRCAELTEGDSCLILPYVPHTFTQRAGKSAGSILALTFGGRLHGAARDELAALGSDVAREFCLPVDTSATAHAGLLRMWLVNGGLTADVVARQSRISADRLNDLLAGQVQPSSDELLQLASALGVSPNDLTPRLPDFDHGIIIRRAHPSHDWEYPDGHDPIYAMTPLVHSTFIPSVRGLVIRPLVDRSRDGRGPLRTGLHQYGYALGPDRLMLGWVCGSRTHWEMIEPGDSFYMKPFITHWFARVPGGEAPGASAVLVLRVAGYVTGGALAELSVIGPAECGRVAGETRAWYDEGERA